MAAGIAANDMSQPKPRLLLVGNAALPAAAIDLLREHAEVVRADASRAAEAVRQGERVGLIASAEELGAVGRELLQSQESALLEALGEAAVLCEASGRVVWANRSFMDLDTQTRERALDACRRLGAKVEEAHRAGHIDRKPLSSRVTIAGAEGRCYEMALSLAAPGVGAAYDSGAVEPSTMPRVAAAIRDVTQAHRTQQKIDALDRAGEELVRLEADTVKRMHVHDRLEFLRKKIVQLAHDLLQFDHFVIYLLDKDTGKLELVMASGLRPGVQDITLHASREGNGISGYVAATGRSYICNDASKDPRYIKGLDSPGASLTTPLLLNDKVIGVFNVESNRAGAFSEDDRHFAEIFSRHVAMTLHMLNLLVAERITTNEAVTGRMEGELQEPLNDLAVEAEWLREQALSTKDPALLQHIERILEDVEAIRRRVRDVGKGAKSILGVEHELATAGEDPLLSGRKILIADDEPEIRKLIEDVLVNRGANVTVCPNGAAAIKALEESHARCRQTGRDTDAVRLVISDIRMPDRNGYEVFSAARRLDERLPVILMTGFGYDPHHSIVRASQEGLQCVLFKPFQVEKLLEEVHRAFGAPPSPSPQPGDKASA